MDSERWYYTDGENSIGPFSRERLQALHTGGIVTDTTLVCQSGRDEWIPFADASGSWGNLTPVSLPASDPADTACFNPVANTESTPLRRQPRGKQALVAASILLLLGSIAVAIAISRRHQEPKVESRGRYGTYPVLGESARSVRNRFYGQLMVKDFGKSDTTGFTYCLIDFPHGLMTPSFSEDHLQFLLISLKTNASERAVSAPEVAEDLATVLGAQYHFSKLDHQVRADKAADAVMAVRGNEVLLTRISALDRPPAELADWPATLRAALSKPEPDRTASSPTGKASTPDDADPLPVVDTATLRAAYKKAAEGGRYQLADWEKKIGQAKMSSTFDLERDWDTLMIMVDDWQSLLTSVEMTVSQKLGPNLYEVRSRAGIFILQTTATEIKSTGRFAAPVRYVKTVGITDKNGFNRDAEVYEEVVQTNPREVADALRQATYSLIANLRKHPAKDEDIARCYGALVKVKAESRVKGGHWFDDTCLVYLLLNERFKGEAAVPEAAGSPPLPRAGEPSPGKETPRPTFLAVRGKDHRPELPTIGAAATPPGRQTPRPDPRAEHDQRRPEPSPPNPAGVPVVEQPRDLTAKPAGTLTPGPGSSPAVSESKRRLAGEGALYLLQYASARTDKGVHGFEPGCEVRRVGPGKQPGTVVVTDGQCQVEVASSLLTSDPEVAAAASSADRAEQLRAASERDRQGDAQQQLFIEHARSVEAAERQRRQNSGVGGRVTPLNQAP